MHVCCSVMKKILCNFNMAILVIFFTLKNGYCSTIDRSTFADLISLTLYEDVKFMSERPHQMNVDALFGLNFVQVHVTAALKHKNVIFLREENRQMLKDILKLCKIAKNDGKQLLTSSAFEMMIRPDMWNRTIFWKRGHLGRKPTMSQGLTRAKAASIMYQGTPSEAESSRCLGELLVPADYHHRKLVCAVSNECAKMLVRKDSSRGYPLTHRLLYVQTAMALGCKENSHASNMVQLVKNYCVAIFQDLVDLEFMNFPAPSNDLAMEQVLLCGMEGHMEFLNEHYASLIASWPNSHGCYSAVGFQQSKEKKKKKREKRSTAFMDFGCDNHASGVAAASLSLLIRSAVENSDEEFIS